VFGSPILDVVAGMVFIYLLLSIICTAANEIIASLFSLRGQNLAKGIANLLADKRITRTRKCKRDLHTNVCEFPETRIEFRLVLTERVDGKNVQKPIFLIKDYFPLRHCNDRKSHVLTTRG
jgi:hypothetical protein